MVSPESTPVNPTLFGLDKRCTLCGQTKPLALFYLNPMGRYGRTSRCKECIRLLDRQKRARLRATRAPYVPPTQKRCPGCHIVQPLVAFSHAQQARDGRQTRCKACQSAAARLRHGIYRSTLTAADVGALRGQVLYTARTCERCGGVFYARGHGQHRRHCSRACAHPVRHDEAFFQTWSDDFAWLLGLVWSDGCLSKSADQVSISSADRCLLVTAAAVAGPANVVLADRGGHKFLLHFYGRTVCDRLRAIGLTPAKSLTIGWPLIPAEHEGAFVRGVLDGDGTVRVGKARLSPYPCLRVSIVTGSVLFRDKLMAWMHGHALRCATQPHGPRCWRVEVCAQSSLVTLYRLLYPSLDVPCLQRKRAPYATWMASPRAFGRLPGDSPGGT